MLLEPPRPASRTFLLLQSVGGLWQLCHPAVLPSTTPLLETKMAELAVTCLTFSSGQFRTKADIAVQRVVLGRMLKATNLVGGSA